MKMRRKVGFWPALLSLRVGQLLLAPELLWAVLIGVGGSGWLIGVTSLSGRRSDAGDFLLLLGPLVGLTLAGLGLVVGLLSDSYLRLLRESPDGVIDFLRPFILAAGFQLAALIGAVAYRASSQHLPPSAEKACFIALSFLFVYASLEVMAVIRNLVAHALLRSAQLETTDAEEAATVRQFGRGQGSRVN